MKIQPIVEGHGEVKAVPILLRRLRDEVGAYGLEINLPIRCRRSDFANQAGVANAVRIARSRADCRAILVLFDGDDDCPKQMAPRVQGWAVAAAGPLPCHFVMAHREFEAWFLATAESLRGHRGIRDDAAPHPSPESVRGAKEALEAMMPPTRSYSETVDQAALCSRFDMATAYRRSRSFRSLVEVFGRIVAGVGLSTGEWPPTSWRQEV